MTLLLPGRLARWGDHLVGPDPAWLPGQRDQRPAAPPHRPGPDARVTRIRRADEFVQRHLVRPGQGQQQLQGRLTGAAFQPGQRAHRDTRQPGHLGERDAEALPHRSQARSDRVQHGIALHPSICCFGNKVCQDAARQAIVKT
jgi:hypothetical protein